MLFASASLDIIFLTFVSIAICNYTFFKDKESKGLKWIFFGVMVLIFQSVISIIDFTVISAPFINPTTKIILNFILGLIASIIVLLGLIKLLIEISE